MRILFITDAWDPQINGVVTSLKMNIAHLEKKGHKIFLIHPGLFRTLPLPTYKEIRLALAPEKTLKKMFEEILPHAIHIVTEGPLGISGRKICMQKNIPFTTAYHSNFPLYLKKRTLLPESLFFPYFRRFHNASIRTIVATQSIAEKLSRVGFRHLAVVPLGVDTKTFSCPKEISSLPYEKPIFVYLGRIASEKNVDDFLKLHLPGTKLLIGDGPRRKALEKRYPKTFFLGYRKGKGISEILCGCDVLVMPSKTETFGLVMLEGLACGLPVAAYPVPGPKDIITNGVNGYLNSNLAEAAKQCLTLDRAKCRKTALQYDWEQATKMLLSRLAIISR